MARATKYYQVSNLQLFTMALAVGIISATISSINIMVKDYLLLPEVLMQGEEKCVAVINHANGDAYTCADVGVILRKFRTRTP